MACEAPQSAVMPARRTPEPDVLSDTPKKAGAKTGKSGGRVIHLTAFGGTVVGALPALPLEPPHIAQHR